MIGLHPIARRALAELQSVAQLEGLRFRLTSGKRTAGSQTELYRRYVTGDPRQPFPVALPGTSTHEYGLAVDLVESSGRQLDLAALAGSLGWTWAGPRDPVHFQVVSQADWSWALTLAPRAPLSVLR